LLTCAPKPGDVAMSDMSDIRCFLSWMQRVLRSWQRVPSSVSARVKSVGAGG
jgi:hypothetical protein